MSAEGIAAVISTPEEKYEKLNTYLEASKENTSHHTNVE